MYTNACGYFCPALFNVLVSFWWASILRVTPLLTVDLLTESLHTLSYRKKAMFTETLIYAENLVLSNINAKTASD